MKWFGAVAGILLSTVVVSFFVQHLNSYYVYLINLTLINSIAAIGLVVLSGAAGLLSLATAALVAVGAYSTGILVNYYGFSYFLALVFAPLVTMSIGSLMAAPALRLTGLHLAIVTLAFGAVLVQLIENGGEFTGGMSGMSFEPLTLLGNVLSTDAQKFSLIFPIFLCTIATGLLFLHLKPGRAFFALKEREPMAQSIGINVARYKLLAFAYSSYLAGLAGCLYIMLKGYISPEEFHLEYSIFYFVMIVIGGMTSVFGGIIGAAIITVLPEVLGPLKEAANATFGLLLVLIIVLAPGGIVGWIQFLIRRSASLFKQTKMGA